MKVSTVKNNSHLAQLIFTLIVAVMLGSYSFMLFRENEKASKKGSSANHLKVESSGIKGTYECEQSGQKSILRISGVTLNNEVEFSLFAVSPTGDIFDKSGAAELKSKSRAAYRELASNCEIEFVFVENRVNVQEKNCNEKATIAFSGLYIKK